MRKCGLKSINREYGSGFFNMIFVFRESGGANDPEGGRQPAGGAPGQPRQNVRYADPLCYVYIVIVTNNNKTESSSGFMVFILK